MERNKALQRMLDIARVYERAAAGLLREWGGYTVETCSIETGGAPLLEAATSAVALPDLQWFTASGARWVEIKEKTRAAWYGREGIFTTGFSVDSASMYKQIERYTGAEVTVIFIHRKEDEVRTAQLSALLQRSDDGGLLCNTHHGMHYFDYHRMRLLCGREDLVRHITPEGHRMLSAHGRAENLSLFR